VAFAYLLDLYDSRDAAAAHEVLVYLR
jgi:hypothetical protein